MALKLPNKVLKLKGCMISILLPTIRPANIMDTLLNLSYANKGEYEIIVVADFPAPAYIKDDPRIFWVFENHRQGPVDAVNKAFLLAQGEYVFVMNDESKLEVGALDLLKNRYEINTLQLLTPKHIPYFPFIYYGKIFAAFPFMNRRTLQVLNNDEFVFDPTYKAFYADPDLSLRAYENNIPVHIIEEAILIHNNDWHEEGHQDNVKKYLNHDQEVFKNRWSHLGEFKDP